MYDFSAFGASTAKSTVHKPREDGDYQDAEQRPPRSLDAPVQNRDDFEVVKEKRHGMLKEGNEPISFGKPQFGRGSVAKE